MKTSSLVFVIACTVLFSTSCMVYRPVDQPAEVIFEDESEINEYLLGYDIYMHNSNGVFQLNNVWTAGDTMWGYVVRVDSSKLTGKSRQTKNDMNILIAEDRLSLPDSGLVGIRKSEIKNVSLMGRDGRASFLRTMEYVGVIGVITMIVIILLVIGVSVWMSDASSDGGSSDGSATGSADASSEASSDASGCYIATMVYGSYEADEVWVLRRFRDHVLQRSRFGRWFINWYYDWSPQFVQKYSKYKFVHRVAKGLLQPIVWLLK